MFRGTLFDWIVIMTLNFIYIMSCCNGSSYGDSFDSTFYGGAGKQRGPFRGHQADTQNDSSNDYYDILGILKSASKVDIKRAYRKKAMTMHPDKGGNSESFKALSEAYEVLSDDSKRQIYDRFGKDGLSGATSSGMSDNFGGPGNFFQNDIFNQFRGFSVPLVFELEVSLADLFKGKKLSVSIRDTPIEINVEKGMMDDQELIAREQFLYGFSKPPRDIIFRIRETQHPIYRRKNADLLMEVSLSLSEALLGFKRRVLYVNEEVIMIKSKDGEVLSPNQQFVIPGMGMPLFGQPHLRGRLFVKVIIEFPKKMWLKGNDLEEFKELLQKGSFSEAHTNQYISPFVNGEGQLEPSTSSSSKNIKLFLLETSTKESFGKVGSLEDENSRYSQNPFSGFFFR